MDFSFKEAFDYKVMYVFTVEDELHRGLVKIGDATIKTNLTIDRLTPNSHELNQAALKRIKQYTNTVGAKIKLLHTELAVKTISDDDGIPQIKAFRDYEVHNVLKNSGIDNFSVADSTGREWFQIDVQMAINAIDAVKANRKNLSGSLSDAPIPIIWRPEQEEAIEKVVKHFKKANRFLVNAKMRYGKTFVSLEIVRRCGFEKTLILTHRPVVDDGWYEDFTKIFQMEKNYVYGSKSKGYTVEEIVATGNKFIYFASVQDLRGSSQVGGKFEKNDVIFNMDWDCVIVDEAHEGTKTALGEDTVRAVVKENTKFLALSGTPFNILDEYEEQEIYTWDYIMEQENKSEWDKNHFGDSNPYDELPELKIYTYELGNILNNSRYVTYDDKAFNFREFFRTWTGEYQYDFAQMPAGAEVGDFVHEQDVWSFLNLLTSRDTNSQYPYSTDAYRSIFKHTLWMVPGVKEASALRKLMYKHPVFGSGAFNIVNVAGNGDKDEESADALDKVKNAIKNAGEDYTITLSCGKLTTGVTIKEWTGVFMLSGSFSTSAANYLQTIFRVQSPCNQNGKIKDTAYVFDFAPDRTLKMIASAVSVSTKAGKTSLDDKQIMGKLLNYCPVISIAGSQMQEYSANMLLQQLKRAYADKVVRNGFDDSNLYNDELFKLNDLDIKKFDELKGIIGKAKASQSANDITVNNQGLTNEQYEEKKNLEKKPKKELTEDEKARLEELKALKRLRSDAISILRGISIRMPLLIYGADIPYEDEITVEKFVELVDDSSWEEFMPIGVTKDKFKEFQKYYDEDVFIAAGRRIRNIAREADELDPTERVQKIAGLFKYFKNPDKETVLTPWRVVNMHMSDCLGGWDFFDETHCENNALDAPRYVNQGKISDDLFCNKEVKILEINSKTGLYPLYIAYSIYRNKCQKDMSVEEKKKIWKQTVCDNVFVVCKTPMAKKITQRTLLGYVDKKINAHYFNDLLNTMENKPQQFIEKVSKESYWKKGNGIMRFNAIVGNPPYQKMDGGTKTSATPIYHRFIEQSKELNPDYLSMITPARWYIGGKGLDSFRGDMLSDKRLEKLFDYPNVNDVFPTVDIAGGVCYFLWNKDYMDDCNVVNCDGINRDSAKRALDEYDILVRSNKAIDIIKKVKEVHNGRFMDEVVSASKPFGIRTFYEPKEKGIPCQFIQKIGLKYADPNDIKDQWNLLDKWKLLVPRSPIAGQTDFTKPVGFYYDGNTRIVPPGTCCTESFIVVFSSDNEDEVKSFKSYLFTKTVRFLLLQCVISQDIIRDKFKFVPDLGTYSGEYTDELLRKMWNITNEEWEYIDSRICNIKGNVK